MPAVYPDYPCRACNGAHTLYYPGLGPVPDLSKPCHYTCTRLPVEIQITRGGRWMPVKQKPEGAVEVTGG